MVKENRHLVNRIKFFMTGIMSIMLMLLILLPPTPVFAAEKLEVHFIDVGQGDAVFISCDGEHMMIDGGSPEESSKIYAYLKKQNVSSVNYSVTCIRVIHPFLHM